MKYFIVVFLSILFYPALAQNSLAGRVSSLDSVLQGITIYITELKTGAVSDAEGKYAFKNLPKGTFLVEVRAIGFKTIVEPIHIDGAVVKDFNLEEAFIEMDEVIVTGVTRSADLKQSPVIIKPIDAAALNENSSTNLIDALKNVPGVNQITTGAAISKPVIRGMGYNRVISLFNGVRQEGQQWGDEHGIEIDEYSIDRVEIIKGPGSLLYGSDGIGGVVNFLTPKPLANGVIKSQVITNYQSNNNLIGYSISNAGNRNGFQWLGRFSSKLAGNYSNKYDGKVYNSGFKEYDGSLFLGLNKKWGYSHLTLSTFNQKLNITEGDRDSVGNFVKLVPDGMGGAKEATTTSDDLKGYKIGFPNQGITHLRAVSNSTIFIKNSSLNLDLAYQNNLRKEFANPSNPNEKGLYFDLKTINYNVRYNATASNGWETSVGANGMFQNNQNKGVEFLIPAYSSFDAGLFVFTQKKITDKFTVAGGIRYDNRHMSSKELILDKNEKPISVPNDSTTVKFKGFTANYGNFSGSAGLTYSLSKSSTLKFNFSRGFRAPNIAEIGSNGKHEGTFRYEYGASDLKAEVSHQIDIAYFLNSDHVTFEFTPFINLIQNYIFLEKLKGVNGTDSIPDLSDPVSAFAFRQGNAQLYGGEVFVDIHPHPLDWLHVENSFSYVRAIQSNQPDSSRNLPLTPAPKYRGEIRAQFGHLGNRLTNIYFKFSTDYYFAQNNFFSAFSTETATPGYALLNVGFGCSVKSSKKKNFLSIYFAASNLANTAYQNHLSRLKYASENPLTGRTGVYNMGRNFSIKLIFTI